MSKVSGVKITVAGSRRYVAAASSHRYTQISSSDSVLAKLAVRSRDRYTK